VLRIVAVHLLTVMSEWAAGIGILVHAFERGGITATGLTSLAILAPSLAGAPLGAVLCDRYRPQTVRMVGLALQALGFGAAAIAIESGLALTPTVAMVVAALTGITLLRPTGAAVLPGTVRSPSELTVANLWVSSCESASSLVGPLAAAAMLALGDATAVLAACAGASMVALAIAAAGRADGPPAARSHDGAGLRRPFRVLGSAVVALRSRPRNLGVLAVVSARNVLIGAFDVLLVLIAFDRLGLEGSGAGVLGALMGAGALVSVVVTAAVARRSHLTPVLAVGLSVAAAGCLVIGSTTAAVATIVALPVIGVSASMLDNLGRILLQRSADPRLLGPVFSLVELVGGFGMLAGSALAQVLVAVRGIDAALIGIGGLLLVVLAATARSLWLVDAETDVPVVEMSLLQRLPMFAPLPPLALEIVARSADHVDVAAGTAVIHQGEMGDRFYAVVDGAFDITMTGMHVRTARRGSFFGEVSLLADVARTATVTTTDGGRLLAIERTPFLVAVTGTDASHAAAWGAVRALALDVELPLDEGPDPSSPLHHVHRDGNTGHS
jgi:hypothetical protein